MKDEKKETPFYLTFVKLCSSKKMSPSAVAKEAGISSGAPTAWKNGAIPKPAQRQKLCTFFGITDEELLGYNKKNKPTINGELTKKQLEYVEKIKGLTDEQQKLLDVFLSGLENQKESQ